MRLEYLSDNLIILLKDILKNQNICKLINYNHRNPYAQPEIENPDSLILKKVFPMPFDVQAKTEEGSQIRIYFDATKFGRNKKIENTRLIFDIICSKSQEIWLINDGKRELIRPYEILSELVTHLSDRSIETVGIINFDRFYPVTVNDKFDCIRLVGDVFTIGK